MHLYLLITRLVEHGRYDFRLRLLLLRGVYEALDVGADLAAGRHLAVAALVSVSVLGAIALERVRLLLFDLLVDFLGMILGNGSESLATTAPQWAASGAGACATGTFLAVRLATTTAEVCAGFLFDRTLACASKIVCLIMTKWPRWPLPISRK